MAGEALTFDELDMSAFLSPQVENPGADDNDDDEDLGFVSLEKQNKDKAGDPPVNTDQDAESSEGNSEGVGKDDGEDDNDDSSQPDPYSSFAKVLAEVGVLPSLDLSKDKIQSADDLIEAVRREIEVAKYANLNDKQKAYLKALENGIPEQEFTQAQSGIDMLEKISADEIKEKLSNELVFL